MTAFILFAIGLVCAAYILGLRYGIRLGRRQERKPSYERGFHAAIDKEWAQFEEWVQFNNRKREGL